MCSKNPQGKGDMKRKGKAIHLLTLLRPWQLRVSIPLKCYTLPYGIFESRFLYKTIFLVGAHLWTWKQGERTLWTSHSQTPHIQTVALPPNEAMHPLTGTQWGLEAVRHSAWILQIHHIYDSLTFLHYFHVLQASNNGNGQALSLPWRGPCVSLCVSFYVYLSSSAHFHNWIGCNMFN